MADTAVGSLGGGLLLPLKKDVVQFSFSLLGDLRPFHAQFQISCSLDALLT